jgi:hypothetical protein
MKIVVQSLPYASISMLTLSISDCGLPSKRICWTVLASIYFNAWTRNWKRPVEHLALRPMKALTTDYCGTWNRN